MSELLDNRSQRIRVLKDVIKGLHAGQAPEQVKERLATLVRQTDASEIAAMEQQLMEEGITVHEIRSMCDLHAAVLRDITQPPPRADLAPGHPVDTFRRENDALRAAAASLRAAVADLLAAPDTAARVEATDRAQSALNDLMDVDKHYRRKEHLLFSFLERYGITGPSKVMWAKDDEVRAALKDLAGVLAGIRRSLRSGAPPRAGNENARPDDAEAVRQAADRAMEALLGMIDKEENVLLPMSLQTLTEGEWGEIWSQSPTYGWCLVEPREGYRPPAAADPKDAGDGPGLRAVSFPTGSVTPEQLQAIFSGLPVDLTFVDVDDRVRFFSEGPGRVFPRSRAIIGRKVQHCHPPRSVEIVERILSDFRAGRQSAAEFWINHHGRFVHIRYLALRDGRGEYLGTLEVTQDLTRLRTLEGERRLLEYSA